MTPDREAELVRAAKEGDRSAFEELASHHYLALYRFCWHMLGNRQAAEDAVQTTVLKALKNLHQQRDDGPFRSWLFQIARRDCLNRYRERRQDPLPPDDGPNPLRDPRPMPGDSLLRAQTRQALRAELAKLTFLRREALTLAYFKDLTCEEIAKIVGASPGTVRARIHKALKQLRKAHERGVL